MDWVETPQSVQELVLRLLAENRELKTRLSWLEEQTKQNSQNSSRPPSGDGFGKKKPEAIAGEKRKRGGQKGHPGHERYLYDESACSVIYDVFPPVCKVCGAELRGVDEHPYRHQQVDIVPIKPQIIEHRLHELVCQGCLKKTRASLPANIAASSYGERLTAFIAWLRRERSAERVKVPKTLADRWHSCPECGCELDRDHNAAINIKQRAVGHPVQALRGDRNTEPVKREARAVA